MIEVRGVNTHNKGAHLMMLAIASALSSHTRLTMSPNGASYPQRATAGYRQSLLLNQAPRTTRTLGNLLPTGALNAYGIVAERRFTGVLDAAGFAYSDSFSPARPMREAILARRWTKRGIPRVFLPQAFGPFEKKEQREWSKALLDDASLVYARDRVSLDYLGDLGIAAEVRLAPDFTVGLDVSSIASPIKGIYGAIVPNEKLTTRGRVTQNAYVESLAAAARLMQDHGVRPVVVIHEFNDRKIGELVAKTEGWEVFTDPSPLVLKRALGDAVVAVASRFHAIVGALSLGTPVAAYGWSHKYEELMTDFGVADWNVRDTDQLLPALDAILQNSDDDTAVLRGRVRAVKEENEQMWTDVRASLCLP